MQTAALFLRHEGYLGAIGAFMNSKVFEEDDQWGENSGTSVTRRSRVLFILIYGCVNKQRFFNGVSLFIGELLVYSLFPLTFAEKKMSLALANGNGLYAIVFLFL